MHKGRQACDRCVCSKLQAGPTCKWEACEVGTGPLAVPPCLAACQCPVSVCASQRCIHAQPQYLLCLQRGKQQPHVCKSGASKQLLVFISQLEKPAPQIAGASSVLSSRRSGGLETFLSIA